MAQIPEKIGRYAVEQIVGQGAMGIVYKARDPGIGRTVAIKVIARHLLTNRSFTERFLSEARSAGQLSHPNIINIYDLGEEDGVPFLVMEYLPGKDLRNILDSSDPLSIGKKIDIMVQVARGLHHAHRRSVYHRDVKPGNIRVLADGQVKIMDFGVAKILSEVPSDLTQTGTIVGTGHYMSPEQIQGLAIDHRSDIFSFGVVLYELLSHRKPFDGDTFTQVMYKIVNSAPPPLPANLRIPDELVGLVGQCLEKNLRDRFSEFSPIIRRLESLAEDLAADSELYLGAEVARLMVESDRLMHESKYAEAIAALDRARELAPASREIEQRLETARREGSIRKGIAAGDELGEAGRLEEALERYRAVLRIDPDSAPVRLAIQRTEKLLDEALRRKDESERIEKLLKAGRDLLQVKQVKQAADCFDQILALRPNHADAKALRAECDAAEGRLRQIAELIEEGRRQMAVLNLEAAERALSQVRKIDSSHFEAAELLREVERAREARRAFERAEDATMAGDWESAATKLREVIRLEPGFPGAQEALVRAEAELTTAGRLRAVQRLLRRGRLEEAAGELRSVLGDRPEHPAARALMAQVEAEIEGGSGGGAGAGVADPDAEPTRVMTPGGGRPGGPQDRALWESPVGPVPGAPAHPRSTSFDQEPTIVTGPAPAAPPDRPAPPAGKAPPPTPAKRPVDDLKGGKRGKDKAPARGVTVDSAPARASSAPVAKATKAAAPTRPAASAPAHAGAQPTSVPTDSSHMGSAAPRGRARASRGPLWIAAGLLLFAFGGWALLRSLTGGNPDLSRDESAQAPPSATESGSGTVPEPEAGAGDASSKVPAEGAGSEVSPAVATPPTTEPPAEAAKEAAKQEVPPVPDPEQTKSLAARDALRKAKDDARRKEALRWAPELYRKAELEEERAADALLASNFPDATRGFDAARKGYVAASDLAGREKAKDAAARERLAQEEKAAKEAAAKEAAAKEAAAKQAAPPPPPPAAEPSNARNAASDPTAAQATQLAEQVAVKGGELNASYPGYAAAREAETRGRQALSAKQYGEAVTQLSSALEGYNTARTRRSTQESAVADLIKRYESAFEAADVNALGTVSILDATERGRWSQFFKTASEIRAEVDPTSTRYDPNGAQLDLRIQLSYMSADRKRVNTAFDKSLYATERDGRWLLMNR